MNKKSILATLLVFILAFSSLAGCKKEDKPADTSTPTEDTSKDETKTEDTTPTEDTATEAKTGEWKNYGDVKLKFLHNWNGGVVSPADPYNNDVAKAIREKIGVTVEIEGIMMNETEKLNLIFASGDMPDMIGAPFWGGTGGETAVIKKAGEEGMLLPLDDLIGQFPHISNAWEVGIVSQAFKENDLEYAGFGGKHYILPVQTPGDVEDITNWTYGAFAREDIVKAIGIDPASVDTPEKVYEWLTKARDGGFKDVNGNDIIPMTTFHDGWAHDQLQQGFDNIHLSGLRMNADNKLVHEYYTDAYMDKVLYIRKLVAENLIDKEAFRCTDAQAEEKVGNGTAAMVTCQYGPIITATKKSGLYNNHPEMRYVPLGPLKYENGDPLVQPESFGRGGTPAIIFPTTNQNLEASLAWIDFINSEEGVLLSQYGIEGDTYTMVDGAPKYNEDIVTRKQAGDPSIDEELRNRGIDYYTGMVLLADKRISWWGVNQDTAVPELEAYKLLRPVKQIKGYPVTSLDANFEEFEDFKMVFAGDVERTARERAYFAATEEEAKAIIEEFRANSLKAEGGVLERYWEYVNELYPTRDDFIY